MMRIFLFFFCLLVFCSSVTGQEVEGIKKLLEDGYEVKAVTFQFSDFATQLYLQKDESVFICLSRPETLEFEFCWPLR